MADGQPVTDEQAVREWVRADFGLDLTTSDPVHHGADSEADLWRAAGADGSRYAVKLSGGGDPAGLVVTAHLGGHGVPGIPSPVPTILGPLWSGRAGRRLSVVPWVSDDRGLDSGLSPSQWRAYGRLLAKVHAVAVTDDLAALLRRETHTHEKWASMTRDVDTRLRAAGDAADPLVRALERRWRAAGTHVLDVVARADALGRRLRDAPAAPLVICHGDPHLGNVLRGSGERVWLIDWDDAVLAPPERDLMFAIGGVIAFRPVTAEQQSWFFEGYGPVSVDPIRLGYYRCVRALEDVIGPATQVLDAGRWPGADRADALSIVEGVLSPAGLVWLALR